MSEKNFHSGFATIVGLLSAVILCYVLQPAAYRWLNSKK